MKCPRCQNRMAFDATIGKMRCTVCGFRLFEDSLEAPQHKGHSEPLSPPGPVTPVGVAPGLLAINLSAGMDYSRIPEEDEYARIRLRARCEDAQLAIARRDYVAARRALHSALELSDHYSEPWFFLAALAETPADQRHFLEQAVACDPTNMRAVEYLTQLNFKARGNSPSNTRPLEGVRPAHNRALEPDEAPAALLICPKCSGQLDYTVGEKAVHCKFCGTLIVDADDLVRTKAPTPIVEELLRSKHQPRIWNIGKRWLHCPACGSITTLSRQTLTNTCRFCGSQQVSQESVNHQFDQPDLILPLSISETDARTSIDRKLRSGVRAFTRFFADAISSVELHAVYLPFWIFDADMNVKWAWSNAPERGENPVILDNVPYFAGSNLSREMLTEAEPFDLSESVDYDPRLLAAIPALLYDMPAVRASIEVRDKLSRAASASTRRTVLMSRPTRSYDNDSNVGDLSLFAMAKFISYRLALLPVWVGRLTEEDGDVRPVIVNGQTAETVLGRLIKKE